ncbi:hypothetical protein J6590_025483 [Homalodisca vitripennis]|nr:hypothetical protein J6590_025483 [Homalodisca vitripennis]
MHLFDSNLKSEGSSVYGRMLARQMEDPGSSPGRASTFEKQPLQLTVNQLLPGTRSGKVPHTPEERFPAPYKGNYSPTTDDNELNDHSQKMPLYTFSLWVLLCFLPDYYADLHKAELHLATAKRVSQCNAFTDWVGSLSSID